MYLQEPYEDECFACMAKSNQLDDVKYWFQAVLDQLVGEEPFDVGQLSYYINEITVHLDMKSPEKPISVVRENRTVELSQMLNAWKQANVQYLKNLAKIGSQSCQL